MGIPTTNQDRWVNHKTLTSPSNLSKQIQNTDALSFKCRTSFAKILIKLNYSLLEYREVSIPDCFIFTLYIFISAYKAVWHHSTIPICTKICPKRSSTAGELENEWNMITDGSIGHTVGLVIKNYCPHIFSKLICLCQLHDFKVHVDKWSWTPVF